MNWLLILVLAVIIINAWIGKRVGLIKIVFSLFSFIISLLITTWVNPEINSILKKNETFYNNVYDKVEEMLDLEDKDTSDQDETIDKLPLPKSIKETLKRNKEKQEENIKAYIITQVTGIVINAISYILTFATVFIALWVLSIALKIISKLPIINQINKLTGFIVGGLQGLIMVWILFLLITVIGGTELGKSAFEQIEESAFLSYLYDKNLLLNIVMGVVKLF